MRNGRALILEKHLEQLTKRPRFSFWQHRELLWQLMTHLILIILGAAFFFPLFWMLMTALKSNKQILGSIWLPNPPVWENFPLALKAIPFGRYTLNTIFICAMNVIGTVISCVLPAYGFARIKWPGREFFFGLMLTTLMLPFQAIMVPLYVIFRNMGWIGSPIFTPLWVPAFFGSAFFIFLLRQFFLGIPEELSDAARIDGCGEFGILGRVIVPLSRPAIMTTALFTFMWNWNDFLWPLICINDDSMYTLCLGLQQYISKYGVDWGQLMAASTIIVAPMIVLFLLAQKNFIEGITMTGIKG